MKQSEQEELKPNVAREKVLRSPEEREMDHVIHTDGETRKMNTIVITISMRQKKLIVLYRIVQQHLLMCVHHLTSSSVRTSNSQAKVVLALPPILVLALPTTGRMSTSSGRAKLSCNGLVADRNVSISPLLRLDGLFFTRPSDWLFSFTVIDFCCFSLAMTAETVPDLFFFGRRGLFATGEEGDFASMSSIG